MRRKSLEFIKAYILGWLDNARYVSKEPDFETALANRQSSERGLIELLKYVPKNKIPDAIMKYFENQPSNIHIPLISKNGNFGIAMQLWNQPILTKYIIEKLKELDMLDVATDLGSCIEFCLQGRETYKKYKDDLKRIEELTQNISGGK